MRAQAAAAAGEAVFPLRPNSKLPLIKDWENKATTNRLQISTWWTEEPNANYGIATGPSRLVVVDLDVHDGTQSALVEMQRLLARNGYGSIQTRIVETPSGGLHLYFRSPEGVELRNTAGKLAPGIDTRAHGGFVVGAGSEIDGKLYRIARQAPILDLPPFLIEELGQPSQAPIRRQPVLLSEAISAYVRKAMENEIGRLLQAKEGTRNHELNRCSFKLGRLVGSGALASDMAETALLAAGMKIGLPEAECRTTIKSGLDAGALKPNHLVIAPPSIQLGLS